MVPFIVTSPRVAPKGTWDEHVSTTGFGVFGVAATGLGNVAGGEATGVGEAFDTNGSVEGDTRPVTPEGPLQAAIISRTDAKAAALIRPITPTRTWGYECGGYTLVAQPAGLFRRR
jgi:hypothetical protein